MYVKSLVKNSVYTVNILYVICKYKYIYEVCL
jgi:hypothetical protein